MPTSVPVQPTITEAGLAAIFNAQSTGVEFALTHIAFGTAQYVPDGTETALQAEQVRVPIAGGGRISPTQIQIYAIAQAVAGSPFFVGEVGFFGDDGTTLLAVYSSTATPNLYLSDTVSTSVSYALGLAALPASSVTVTIDPSASAALLLIGQHVAAADPHPQYVEKVNGVAFYDPTLAFEQGAQIIGDDLLVYQSIQANNIGNAPSTSPTWWEPLYNYGDTPIAGLTNASVTLTSTQAARAHMTLSGALTASLNIVFPTWVKDWTVVNETTGAFSITCKTAAGTGVVIPQNGSPTRIRGDGTNITQPAENIAPATEPQHAVQFAQVVGIVGSAQHLKGSAAAASIAATYTAEQVLVATALNGLTYLVPNVNASLSLTAANGIGGMDTGSAPASGYVYVYLMYNPTTGASGLMGLSVASTGAIHSDVYDGTHPVAGYTASALIGIGATNASGQFVGFTQINRVVQFAQQTMYSGTSQQAQALLSLAAYVPPNATKFYANAAASVTGSGGSFNSYLSSTATSQWGVGTELGSNPPNLASGSPAVPNTIVTPQTTYVTNAFNTTTASVTYGISGYEF